MGSFTVYFYYLFSMLKTQIDRDYSNTISFLKIIIFSTLHTICYFKDICHVQNIDHKARLLKIYNLANLAIRCKTQNK